MNLQDMFKDALPVIENVAPLVARTIGGYPALAFDYLLPLLVKNFGIHTGDVGQLIKDIVDKKDAQDKLKMFEHDHKDLLENLLDNFGKLSHAEVNVKLDFQAHP